MDKIWIWFQSKWSLYHSPLFQLRFQKNLVFFSSGKNWSNTCKETCLKIKYVVWILVTLLRALLLPIFHFVLLKEDLIVYSSLVWSTPCYFSNYFSCYALKIYRWLEKWWSKLCNVTQFKLLLGTFLLDDETEMVDILLKSLKIPFVFIWA